jgi:hypothetical protein
MLQCGDIILTYSGGFISESIRWILDYFQKDHAKFSHCAIAVSETEVVEANWNGIVLHSPHSALKGVKHYKIVRYKFLTDGMQARLKGLLLSKVGTRYNYWRLIMQLFDNVFRTNWFTKKLSITKREEICSTYISWAYYKATGVRFNDIDWISVEPDDIDDEVINDPMMWIIVKEI